MKKQVIFIVMITMTVKKENDEILFFEYFEMLISNGN